MSGPVFELPEQPAEWTVVFDARGRAYQRTPAGWYRADNSAYRLSWADILATGRVEVVYSPEGADLIDPDHDLVERLRKAIRVRGGNVQYVLGSDR